MYGLAIPLVKMNIWYRKSSIKSPGTYLGSRSIWKGGGGVSIETGGLFNSEKMMVSVIHKELEYKVEKLKYKKVGGHAN